MEHLAVRIIDKTFFIEYKKHLASQIFNWISVAPDGSASKTEMASEYADDLLELPLNKKIKYVLSEKWYFSIKVKLIELKVLTLLWMKITFTKT